MQNHVRISDMSESKILLASNSPRRRELLSWLGLPFSAVSASVDETPLLGEHPEGYVRRLALEKSHAVADQRGCRITVLAADTTVADENSILGKPCGTQEAVDMLRRLRGRRHQVYTAICVLKGDAKHPLVDVCVSPVTMREYSEAEIEAYVSSGDPLDKAGAYAIQHEGFHPVCDFRHCFANVMGLPLCHLARVLPQVGLRLIVDVPQVCQQNLGYVCPVYPEILRHAERPDINP